MYIKLDPGLYQNQSRVKEMKNVLLKTGIQEAHLNCMLTEGKTSLLLLRK